VRTLLLDTDACIEVIRGNPAPVEAFPADSFVISTVSRFEILSGLRGNRSRKREARARAFLETAETLPFDEKAADEAAHVRILLKSKGTLIGAYDLLLAGQALALDAPLVTGNLDEFGRVPGLEVLTWR
jgi:tRNA(fMet)-specific endonuclease VapC